MFFIIVWQELVRKGGWLLPLKRGDDYEGNIKFSIPHIVYSLIDYFSYKTITAPVLETAVIKSTVSI